MKKLVSTLLPLFLFISCETEISGPVEVEPQVTGVKLKWIGYGGYYSTSGSFSSTESVYYVGTRPSFPDDILSDSGGDGWTYPYECTEIELFQSEGYFNFIRPEEPNVTITRSIGNYTDLIWEEL
tara:strand:- start:343 stop:717 length:375 start_codon:yes stop_codon:yes gene_type:complete